jgi:hypothetical protein
MGACVSPALADAFCGSAARAGAEGCAFRTCPTGQRLDVASGECVGASGLGFGGCGEHELPILEGDQVSCVPPDATCPRDTRRIGGVCARGPSCPPGSLPDGASCRGVVTIGAGGRPVVDIGVWAALAIGIDGGLGSEALCRPLTQRPSLLGGAPESPQRVDIQVALSVPDQDISSLGARIVASAGGLPLPPAAEAVATDATTTLLELLRSLGDESTAAAVGVRVRCELGVR